MPSAPSSAQLRNVVAGGVQRTSSTDKTTRSTIAYDQTATSDLAQAPKHDNRARYARYKKSDKPVRVLDNTGRTVNAGRRSGSSQGGEDFSRSAQEAQERWLLEQKGMTIREHRIRQSRSARKHSRAPRNILIALIGFLMLAVIAAITYISPAFTIQNVEVNGANMLREEHVSQLVGGLSESTLLRVDSAAIESALLQEPWIAEVRVGRSFPSTLTLNIVERKVMALAEISSFPVKNETTHWLVSTDGLWLGQVDISQLSTPGSAAGGTGVDGTTAAAADGADAQGVEDSASTSISLLDYVHITNEQLAGVVRIRDLSANINPQLGLSSSDEGLTNALAVIDGFSDDMLARINFISAADRVNTSLTLDNNVEVAFGAAEDIAAKEKVIMALLGEHEGMIVYINVRVVDRPTYRSA